MTPFKPAFYPPEHLTVEHWLAKGYSEQDAKYAVDLTRQERVFRNNVYQVALRDLPPSDVRPDMIHISVKRIDRKRIRDWRDLQEIKNELVGRENEAAELFPAESRLVDSANQYHLWALKDPADHFPFGYRERLVGGPEEAARVGAKQSKYRKVKGKNGAAPVAP